MATTTNVEEVCRRLQAVHLQLKIILERNLEIQGHLHEVENIANDVDTTPTNKQHMVAALEKSKSCTEKVKSAVEDQCEVLRKSVEELERTADGQDSGLHSVPDANFSEVRMQLKTQLNDNVRLQKEKAELEMRLEEQIRAYKKAGEMTVKLQDDFEASKKMVIEIADNMDNRTTQVEDRLFELQKETEHAQELATKYQKLYKETRSNGQPRPGSSPVNGSNSSGYNSPASNNNASPKRAKSALPKPADIDSRFLTVVEENTELKHEVKRLREDNKELVKKTKNCIKDVDQVQQHIATCSAQKMELQKRLHREQEQNRKLSSNMTKQASEWVTEKKLLRTTENMGKVKSIHTEPVFDGHVRHKSHPVRMNVDKPRDIPVHQW